MVSKFCTKCSSFHGGQCSPTALARAGGGKVKPQRAAPKTVARAAPPKISAPKAMKASAKKRKTIPPAPIATPAGKSIPDIGDAMAKLEAIRLKNRARQKAFRDRQKIAVT